MPKFGLKKPKDIDFKNDSMTRAEEGFFYFKKNWLSVKIK